MDKLAGPLWAAEYAGKIISIGDGDTMTLLVPDGAGFEQVKVRLGEIDAPSGGFTGAGKRRCREMTGCEEARFYLDTCGVRSPDGNNDGVPRETPCR